MDVGPLSPLQDVPLEPILLCADPYLIDCSCWRCSRGSRCKWMRDLIDRHDTLAALTDEDRAWLRAHGWDGTLGHDPGR